MASTASIFNPSPRKKTLVERSEPVRSWVSLSDGKAAIFFSQELEYTPVVVGVSMPDSIITYDPIMNSLSPRPQFRCYKPNPRIAALVRKQKEAGSLEDDILFDHFSEEVSEEEESSSCSPFLNDQCMSPYDPITNYLSPRPQFRCYKPNPIIAALLRKQKEMGPLEDEDDDDDSMFSLDSEEVSEEEGEESLDFDSKIEKKLWGVMCFSMVVVMMMMVACVSVSDTKPPEFGLIEDLSFSDLGRFYHQSRVVATNTSNAKCIWSFVSKATNGLGEGGITPVQLIYVNHSDLQKGYWYDVVEVGELDSEMGKFEEKEYVDGVYDSDDSVEDEQDDQVSEIDEIMHSDSSELDSKYWEDTQWPEEIITSSMPALEIEKIVPANSEQEPVKGIQNSEDKFPANYYVVGFSFFLAALSATVVIFKYHYKRVPSLRVDKKTDYEFGNNKQKNHPEEKAVSSQNWKTEVDDDASFTSAPRRFLMSTKTRKCYSKREWLVSSSSDFMMGSPSYGSFTTLVKIPVKNANVKEEITTPVRRSSRIRSHQLTSP